MKPGDAESLQRAKEFFRETLGISTMAGVPAAEDVAFDVIETLPNGESLAIGRRSAGDRIPAVILQPKKANPAIAPTLLIHPEGTAWLLSSAESQGGFVNQLLRRGGTVMSIDAFETGRARVARDIKGADWSAEKFYTTYNRSDDANRVQDVLTALSFLRTRTSAQPVNLVGIGIGGVWSLYARALADTDIRLLADMDQFETTSDAEFEKRFFISGIRRAGDFLAAAVLQTGGKTLLHNLAPSFPSDWYQASFQAAGAGDQLDLRLTPLADAELLEMIAPDPKRKR
jgi:hypothetical protein